MPNKQSDIAIFINATSALLKTLTNNPDVKVTVGDAEAQNLSITQDSIGDVVISGIKDSNIFKVRGAVDEIIADKLFCPLIYNISTEKSTIYEIFETYRKNAILWSKFNGCKNNITKAKTESLREKNIINSVINALYEINFEYLYDSKINAVINRSFGSLNTLLYDYEAYTKYITENIIPQIDIGNITESKTSDKISNESEDNQQSESKASISENAELDESKFSDIKKIQDKLNGISEDSDAKEKGQNDAIFTNQNDYKVFTRQFDKIAKITSIIDKHETEQLKRGFLQDIKNANLEKQHANKLFRLMYKSVKTKHHYNMDDGLIDRKKLTRIVMNKTSEPIFYKTTQDDDINIAVSILVDNSGSMRGSLINISSIVCYFLVQTLEKLKIPTEVLGFTTCAWQGGNSLKIFESIPEPKPINVGRINDILHIIYKSFAEKSTRANLANIGLMRSSGILKENIDGEALLWAYERIVVMKQKSKILIVISDGTPVDDTTLSFNRKEYLTDHLKCVINQIESNGTVSLLGFGIMHDIEKFYKNSVRIDSIIDMSEKVFDSVVRTLQNV